MKALKAKTSPPPRSFVFSTAITFILGYAISNAAHFIISNLNYYRDFTRERALQVVEELELGQTLLKDGELSTLQKRLEHERSLGQIGFFLLRENERNIFFGNAGGDLQSIDISYSPNQFTDNDKAAYGSVNVGNYQLIIGTNKRRTEYLRAIFEVRQSDLGGDLLLLGLLIGIVMFFFKDIRDLIQIMGSPRREGLKLPNARTAEATIIARNFSAYEKQSRGLQDEREDLRRQLSDSLRTELASGKTPPYQFQCVLVRTDINSYSTIYSRYPVEEFMAVINEFFSRSSEIIARYGGYVTEFVGDEIVYYFKEEEHENAAAVAIAAVRDIHFLAEEMSEKTVRVNGYVFRVKSALADGALRYGAQVHGYALSGAAFVETVRILSEVEEREQNSVTMPRRIGSRVSEICETEFQRSVQLKGVPGVTELITVLNFTKLNPHSSDLRYYLGDFHLKEIFGSFQYENNYPRLVRGLKQLRKMGAPSENLQVYKSFTDLIEKMGKDFSSAQAKPLAMTLSLTIKVIAKSNFKGRLRTLIQESLRSSDNRIVANAIDVFIFFEPSQSDEAIKSLTRHPNCRVVANVLIKLGLTNLSNEIVQGLRILIESEDPNFQASGIYAAGELAGVYRSTALPIFESQLKFQTLLEEISVMPNNSDSNLGRQIAVCLQKAGLKRVAKAA